MVKDCMIALAKAEKQIINGHEIEIRGDSTGKIILLCALASAVIIGLAVLAIIFVKKKK